MENHVNKFVVVWALALTAFLVMGLTVPNTFTAGTTISSAEMNANFAAINAAVTALETTPGQIRGFARIAADAVTPTVTDSFMANGGTPTVSRFGMGIWEVTFPGESVSTFATNRCVLANGIAFGNGYVVVSGATPDAVIRTYDAAGALVDTIDFWVLITGAP